jgi:uncharacterized protein (TIGR02145 family)
MFSIIQYYKLFTLNNLLVIVVLMGACSIEFNEPPIAMIKTLYQIGDTTTVFLFDATNSRDYESESCYLKSRWDFTSDGIWDTDFSTNLKMSYRFLKLGQYNVTVQILDQGNLTSSDSIKITILEHIRDSSFIDQRDLKTYRIVKIQNQWWMAEDLLFGNQLNPTDIPKDNGIPEYFVTEGQSISNTAYYSWNEATNYGKDTISGICPDGWRLARKQELETLGKYGRYVTNMNIYFGHDGFYGLNIPLNGLFISVTNQIRMNGQNSYYWIAGKRSDGSYDFWFHDEKYQLQVINSRSNSRYISWIKTDYPKAEFSDFYLTVRCLKDE